MGQLMSGGSQQRDYSEIAIDLENPPPSSEADKKVCDQIRSLLQNGAAHLAALHEYKGCEGLIRQAIGTPSKENDDAAWAAVVPCVYKQKDFFEFSTNIETAVIALCNHLVSISESTLQQHQAVLKELCELFNFVISFDEKKMSCPHIQNDFSYYRRTINRQKGVEQSSRMKDEVANKISMFFASPTPMMKVVTDTTRKFLLENPTALEPFTQSLALITNVFQGTIQKQRIHHPAAVDAVLRSMTGCLILYDHIHPLGVFHKRSPVQVKRCIELLKRSDPPQNGLLNSIRYTTIHINDRTTPKGVTALLAN